MVIETAGDAKQDDDGPHLGLDDSSDYFFKSSVLPFSVVAHPVEDVPAVSHQTVKDTPGKKNKNTEKKRPGRQSIGGSGRKKKKEEEKDSEARNVEDKTVLTVSQDCKLDQQIEAKAIRFLDLNDKELEVHEYAKCNPVNLLSVRFQFALPLFCSHIILYWQSIAEEKVRTTNDQRVQATKAQIEQRLKSNQTIEKFPLTLNIVTFCLLFPRLSSTNC